MSNPYRDKVNGFGIGGGPSTRTVVVPREDKPGVAGVRTDHKSGRVDMVATPDPVRARMKAQGPDA